MRKEVFAEENFYHIYNRGVDKRLIFGSDKDRVRFVHTIYVLNNFVEIPHRFDLITLEPKELLTPTKPLIKFAAGCLMSNHYHSLVTPLQKNGITKLFHKLGTSYTMYFNKRNERTGRLFENIFKARHVDSHEYASYLTQYIHLNPLELFRAEPSTEEILRKVELYEWSTLPDYLGKTSKLSILLNPPLFRDEVLDMDAVEYKKFLHDLYLE